MLVTLKTSLPPFQVLMLFDCVEKDHGLLISLHGSVFMRLTEGVYSACRRFGRRP